MLKRFQSGMGGSFRRLFRGRRAATALAGGLLLLVFAVVGVAFDSHGRYARLIDARVNLQPLTVLAILPIGFAALAVRAIQEHKRRRNEEIPASAPDPDPINALQREDFDLRQLVEGTVDQVASRAVQKQLELLAYVAPGVPKALRGDAARLRQVLLHLLANALEFTPAGEVTLQVQGECEEAGRLELRFAVVDTGVGMSPETQAALFPGQRASKGAATAKRVNGANGSAGGLTLARGLVAELGGRSGVESTPGKGSTVWFCVPLEKQAGEAQPRPDGDSESFLRGVRVLVVDDNATSRTLISQRLTAWGMQPATAENAGAALAQLREQALAGSAFEVALLDLNLGSMDGFTLAWSITSQPMLSDTRLVLMTAVGLQTDASADQQVGIAASVTKPLKHDALVEALRIALGKGSGDPAHPALPMPKRTHVLNDTRRVLTRRLAVNTGGERVLLADDNPINRKLTLRQLANLGYVADAVTNGREVLAALRVQPYAIVLLDMHMPELDGYETAQTIRRLQTQPVGERLALIAMTANRSRGDRERCLALGMDDYLSKPVNQQDLERVLARWRPRAHGVVAV